MGSERQAEFSLSPYRISLFAETESDAIVYALTAGDDAEEIWRRLSSPRPAFVVIDGADWNSDFSPWPAPRAFGGGQDFSGGGEEFLRVLTEQIVPRAEQMMGFAPASRALAGYSLAGLFSLWAATKCGAFDRIASASGSLWYDGFLPYLAQAQPPRMPEKVYLSVGVREKQTKNARLKTVEDCTRQTAELLRVRGIPVTFVLNEGGHFDDPAGRMAAAIDWLFESEQDT